MEYSIENELLKVTVTDRGSQICSVICKRDGVEHIWQADPNVWGKYGPILFPHCGGLTDGVMNAKGNTYQYTKHGFAKEMTFSLAEQSENQIVLELTDGPETMKYWPYKFRLLSTLTLEGDTVHHTLTVENRDEEEMPFGIGFHPAFAVPFDDQHKAEDYALCFDQVENPICMATPKGMISGETYRLGTNITSIPLDEKLFANDSHCMTGLQSKTLGLYEKDTGRGVVCSIRNFPYCLIWSMPGTPHFVCIEPWHSLPGLSTGSTRWEDKPAAAILAPGESWSTTLSIGFVR